MSKKSLLKLIYPLSLFFLASCSVGTLKSYEPSYKTTRALKEVKGSYVIRKVWSETMIERRKGFPKKTILDRVELSCRGSSFSTPNRITLGEYIKSAFNIELDAAGLIKSDDNSATSLVLKVLEIDLNTFGNSGEWIIRIVYNSDNDKREVSTVYKFDSAFSGEVACTNAKESFEAALSKNFRSYFSSNLDKN